MNPPQQKGWFGRNWKWLVPTGCLSLVVVAGAVVAAIAYLAFGSIKSSYPYQEAMTRTRSNADAIRELGEPIESGWLVSGNIQITDSSGRADLSIPVSGPKKSGKVYVLATKRMGNWNLSALELEIEGEAKRINLLIPSTQ
jgi:hypothetical protein